ncbi:MULTISPECIES: MarR family winged helix-turn-helix transcriptional regulator [unclassified Streptomyces]|uniref:MarR family winged helix-turn-helix transcriptional regulator n=1 Tax=unclassified Streptomyces TaxID=2593676 RepID=UPI0022B666A5|nr:MULTISPECIES: MarR family transcriptional regulator [unclassified Streptomyces]MCZ7414945.1 MarR family transcriptional regulator [Streptomyces sp. WMMC897]MCZ7431888.1 MarR family transcriptional regulator [Streptomyces sp. WMMC1477]
MGLNPAPPHGRRGDAARLAAEVVELLEVVWERGRDAVSSSPVSTAQLRVMYSLDREEGVNLRTLGTLLGAGPSSVSRLCDRLEAIGFVERSVSQVSRRELELRLTGEGKAFLRDLRVRREEVLSRVLDAMAPAARSALAEGLRGFRDAFDVIDAFGAVEAPAAPAPGGAAGNVGGRGV